MLHPLLFMVCNFQLIHLHPIAYNFLLVFFLLADSGDDSLALNSLIQPHLSLVSDDLAAFLPQVDPEPVPEPVETEEEKAAKALAKAEAEAKAKALKERLEAEKPRVPAPVIVVGTPDLTPDQIQQRDDRRLKKAQRNEENRALKAIQQVHTLQYPLASLRLNILIIDLSHEQWNWNPCFHF